jgi:non-canonical purine NTP pyrophosphatase (RdgB/HAM1 family)
LAETLLIGSGNTHKATELAVLLRGLPWTVKSLKDFPEIAEPEETGATFEDNALLKARYYSRQFEVVCVADDSGLCVDALDGAPGVYSARFAGPGCSYEDNNKKLRRLMEPVSWFERTARFVCCAALAGPGVKEFVAEGGIEGHIAVEPFGKNGFGYDPLFVPEGYEETFAEMSADKKNQISHRALAFAKMKQHLASLR